MRGTLDATVRTPRAHSDSAIDVGLETKRRHEIAHAVMPQLVNLISKWYSIPLLILLWQIADSTGLIHSRLLPPPSRVWHTFVAEVADGALIYHAGVTFSRALIGFALAALVGVPFAAAMARSETWRNLFEPIFFLGYPIPKVALFPIFTYTFGIGSWSKITFTFLECLYPIVITCYFGFRSIQSRLIWTAQNFGAGRMIVLRRVIIPAAMPSIFSGLRIALPVAVIVVVITEMLSDSIGLGYYITIWSTRFSFENVYAAILMISIGGFILDRILMFVRRRVIYWQKE